MKRYLETGNFAITQGAMLAGCNAFAGYPITPATEIAEAMSVNLPRIGGYYMVSVAIICRLRTNVVPCTWLSGPPSGE
jgi:TPP-dependent indolepyruvate ferredoxin oxidoreductase alpha subunit